MPNFYSHQVFGKLVWDELPEETRAALASDQPGFQLGLYGPDPLFFYHPLWPNRLCREGHLLHRQTPGVVLERYRSSDAVHTPYARGYAAGYLCHYVLDAACHPYVLAKSGGNSLRHLMLEGAFDRMLSDSQLPVFPVRIPELHDVAAAAAIGYQNGQPKQLELASRRFSQIIGMTRALRRVTPAHKTRRLKSVRLRKQLLDAVDNAVALTTQLVNALQSGQSLDFLPQTDFSGRPVAAH